MRECNSNGVWIFRLFRKLSPLGTGSLLIGAPGRMLETRPRGSGRGTGHTEMEISMNAINTTIRGNVTHMPQFHSFDDGGQLAVFSVAVNDHYFDQDKREWRDRKTEFVKVQVRRSSLVNNLRQSVQKGMPVIVRGRLGTATWKDSNEVERHDLVLHADSVGVELTFGSVTYSKNAPGWVDQNTGEYHPIDGEGRSEPVDDHDEENVSVTSMPPSSEDDPEEASNDCRVPLGAAA